jgi:putative zinc finger/helix-turn-helix YgiT family protein
MSITSLDNHLHRFCGGRYQQAVERVTIRLSGMSAAVERGLYRCAKCGDEQRTIEQREAAERAAVERMRAEHGLLSAKEIRQLREGAGLSAAQLGELLYGMPRGVVEGWERGRYLQNRAADALLRALRDPLVRAERAAKAGVTLPEPGVAASAAGAAGTLAGPGEHGAGAPAPPASPKAAPPVAAVG